MGCTGCKLCLRAAPGHGGAELGSQHAAEPRQPMCSPDTSGVGARASPLGRHWCSPCTAPGPCSRCPMQLGLGTVGLGALDRGRAFAPSCQAGICPAEHKLWVRSQAQPQAAPFPAAPGGLSCRQDLALHTASPQPPCTPQAMLGRGLVPCCGHRVLPSLPASPGTQRPALCQGVPCPGPPVPSPCPVRSVAVEAKSRSCRHCVEMAAGLPARLGTGCAARGLRGRRLAHSGAAARLQQEYDAVVIGAGNAGRGAGGDGAAPSVLLVPGSCMGAGMDGCVLQIASVLLAKGSAQSWGICHLCHQPCPIGAQGCRVEENAPYSVQSLLFGCLCP